MRFSSLLLMAIVYCTESRNIIHLSNTASVAGESISFVCGPVSEDTNVLWMFQRAYSYGEVYLYNSSHVLDEFSHFSVRVTNDGLSILSKASSDVRDGGTYKCILRQKDRTPMICSAQLMVLDGKPECTAIHSKTKEGDLQIFSCRVNFTGNLSPGIKWLCSNGTSSSFHFENTSEIINVSALWTFRKRMSTSDNGITFRFMIYFKEPLHSNDQPHVHTATNAPSYKYEWLYQPNVLFAPRSIQIAPKKDLYNPGDVLHCVADGNPTPQYEWTEVGSNHFVGSDSSLTVTDLTMNNRTYQCTAWNEVSEKHQRIVSTIAVYVLTTIDSVRLVTIVAGVFCLILFVVIFPVVVRCLKKWLGTVPEQRTVAETEIIQNAEHNDNDKTTALNEEQNYESIEDLEVNNISSKETAMRSSDLDIHFPMQPSNLNDSALQALQPLTIYTQLGRRSLPKTPNYECLKEYKKAKQRVNSDFR